MENSQMNAPLGCLPLHSGDPWLSYDLNLYKELPERLADQRQLAATLSNINPKPKTTQFSAAAASNTSSENTAVINTNLTPYESMEKASRLSSKNESKTNKELDSANAITSLNAFSTAKMDRKRTQNRMAQRAFRQRKHQYAKDLEVRNNELESEVKRLQQENRQLSSLPPHNQNQNSGPRASTPCCTCRHIMQFWSNGMICPDPAT